jgi:lycopene cyclase domain-containing protein
MWGHMTYLGLLLPWALPILGLQWAVGHTPLRRRVGTLLLAAVIPTAYLVGCDAVALSQGIWTIHDDRIVGVRIGNVPLEEALFFLFTDLMVVQSIILLNAPEADGVLRRLGRVRGRRR